MAQVNGHWPCTESGCDVVDNVWLNLSTGRGLCGRRQMIDADTMQQGNEHVKKHYEATSERQFRV